MVLEHQAMAYRHGGIPTSLCVIPVTSFAIKVSHAQFVLKHIGQLLRKIWLNVPSVKGMYFKVALQFKHRRAQLSLFSEICIELCLPGIDTYTSIIYL